MTVLAIPLGVKARAGTGKIAGNVTVVRGRKDKPKREHSGIVVYLPDLKIAARPGENHEIRQINEMFVEEVNVVTKNTVITFPNDDPIFHNVFSNSEAAKFDLGSYRKGAAGKAVKFKHTGQVEVYCNIHHHMRATILVLDSRHSDVTEEDGKFWISDVPAGTHRYIVWQRDGRQMEGTVTVVTGETTTLDLTIKEGRPKRHRKKDGGVYY